MFTKRRTIMADFKAKNTKKNVYETKSFKRKYYDNCIKDYYVIVETDRAAGTRDIYITDDDSGHYMNSRHCKGIIAARALKEQLLKEDKLLAKQKLEAIAAKI